MGPARQRLDSQSAMEPSTTKELRSLHVVALARARRGGGPEGRVVILLVGDAVLFSGTRRDIADWAAAWTRGAETSR